MAALDVVVKDESDIDEPVSPEPTLLSSDDKGGLVSQLVCHFCGLQFDVKKTRSLRAHIEEVHVLGDAGYMCSICCEEFTSRKAVESHMSTFHRTPKPLGCGVCGETFRVRNLLLRHIDSHTKVEVDNNKVGLCYCGECFEFFNNIMSLQIHSLTHREVPVFVCGACGLQTSHRNIMVKHLETHVISNLLSANGKEHQIHQQVPVEIDLCRIQDEDKLKIEDGGHTSVATEHQDINQETSYKCGVCFAAFVNLDEALEHAETHQDHQELEGKRVELSVIVQEHADIIHEDIVHERDTQEISGK